MFKKLTVAAAVLAATTGFAFANGGTYQPAPAVTHSAYVGVAVSRDFFYLDGSHQANSIDLGDAGWDGELNAGIGWVFQDQYYLGGEIFGDLSSAQIDTNYYDPVTRSSVNGDIKYKGAFGIDLVPGVKISDSTMLYGKVGYIHGYFDENVNALGYSEDDSQNESGLQLGLGMETMITNNVSAKMEYDYNYFSKIGDVRPKVETVKLGVAYHFMAA